jgi:Na+-driven multidrug efflux pump
MMIYIRSWMYRSASFIGFRDYWALMFNTDPEVVEMTSSILPLCALFQGMLCFP